MPRSQVSVTATPGSDRVPPHSEEAERGVLGSAMMDAERVLDLCVGRGLTADAFYVPSHQLVFRTLMEMQSQSRPVDLLTVTARLRGSPQ